jgi:hypothetical protein
MVPASILRYGSILIAVTRSPNAFISSPVEDAMTPLPIPEITPPQTTINFVRLLGASSTMIFFGGKRKISRNFDSDKT